MASSGITRALLASLAVISCAGCGPSARNERQQSLTFERLPPVDLRLQTSPAYDARIAHAAQRALRRLGEWLSPYPHAHLTIVPLRSQTPAAAGTAAVETPWLAPARGGSIEAAVVLGIARQFWSVSPADAADPWLQDGLALYFAAKVLDDQFRGEHAHERRAFGGLVPHVLRSVPVEGPDAQLARLPSAARALRAAVALLTLERYLGWGALQQALATFAERSRAGASTVADLFQVLDSVSGRDLAWFREEGFDPAKSFDYGVDRLETGAARDRPTSYDTSVVVRRYGDAVFAGTGRPVIGPFQSSGPLEILVRFADGSEMREHWDGRAASVQYDYESRSPAVSAAVDPNRILWLDRNPSNNQRRLGEDAPGVWAWAARWAVWMQDSLLDYAFFF